MEYINDLNKQIGVNNLILKNDQIIFEIFENIKSIYKISIKKTDLNPSAL